MDLKRGIKRIEDEDVSFIEEEEARLKFLGLSQSKRELQRAIQEMSFKHFSSIPIGLHSGMLTMNYSGLVVAMEFELKGSNRPITKWVFEPDQIHIEENKEITNFNTQDDIIDNMNEIEKIIICAKETKRIVIEPPEEIYKRAVKIMKKVRGRLRQKTIASKMKKSYEKGNKKIANIFLKAIKGKYLEREKAERFLHYLQNQSFNAIRNTEEVKPIVQELNETLAKIDDVGKLDQSIEGLNHSNKLKGIALEKFLKEIYQYFDQNDIEIDWKTKKTEKEDLKVKLIGILRVYTKETYDTIQRQYLSK
ncbi:MAG: hypothetical protein ACTSRA_22485 [Promethearchaeota archaeon]